MNSKIVSRQELVELAESFKLDGKTIVFTNGCFDILHVGHVRYLQEARELGDVFIVAVNSDSSVKKIKGNGRPIVPANERAEILAALSSVDFVTIFDEETPETLLSEVKPDWHVKGGDYKPSDLPESKIVAGYGGKIKILSFTSEHSTSHFIEKLSHADLHKRKQSG